MSNTTVNVYKFYKSIDNIKWKKEYYNISACVILNK